jgi:hypothetical protein
MKSPVARMPARALLNIWKVVPVFALFGGLIQAAPITYTFSGSGTGTLATTAFTNANFVVTLTSDTSQAIPQSQLGNELGIIPIAAQINITGVGTETFTGTTFLAISPFQSPIWQLDFGEGNAGLFSAPGNLFELRDATLNQYNLVSNFTDSGTNLYLSQFLAASTNGGALTFTSMSPISFQATVGQASVAPEPGTAGMLLAGLAGLAIAGRARFNRRSIAAHSAGQL